MPLLNPDANVRVSQPFPAHVLLPQCGMDMEQENTLLQAEDANLRQRQLDVHAAAEAAHTHQELRWMRRMVREGRVSYHELRRLEHRYRLARGEAPSVWRWGPHRVGDAEDESALPRAA